MPLSTRNLFLALLTAAAISLFLAGCGFTENAAARQSSSEASLPARDYAAAAREAEKARLNMQISTAENERATLASTLATLSSEKANLEAQARKYVQAEEETRITTKAYMMEHKMAVLAIVAGVAGAGLSLNSSNTFSQDAKDLGTGAVILAGLYALANAREVTDVLDRIVKADSFIRDLQAATQRINQEISGREAQIETIRQDLSRSDAALLQLRDALNRV